MTKAQFMKQLEDKLSSLPESEKSDALNYFEEYFADSPKSEDEIVSELGSPAIIAKQILAEYKLNAVDEMKPSPKKSFSAVWVVLLAIFAIPIGFPLVMALLAVAFAVIVSIFAIVFSLFVSGIACLISGVATIAISVPIMFSNFFVAIGIFGSGLVAIGLGILLITGTYYLNKLIVRGLINLAKTITRSNRNEEKI